MSFIYNISFYQRIFYSKPTQPDFMYSMSIIYIIRQYSRHEKLLIFNKEIKNINLYGHQ